MIITFLIASNYFYLIFEPIVNAEQNAFWKYALFSSGALVSSSLLFLLSSANISEGNEVVSIPLVMAFYFTIGTVVSLIRSQSENTNYVALFYKGALLLLVLTMVAFAFSIAKHDYAYILSINIFFVAFAVEFWGERFLVQSKWSELNESTLESFKLTPTELKIARLLAEGKDYQEVADALGRKVDSLYTHFSNIYKKTNTIDRTAFVMRFGAEVTK